MNLPKPNLPFEQKDKMFMNTRFRLSFWMRICILFSSEVTIESEVYTAEEMPDHKAVTGIEAITWWQSLKRWYLSRKYKGIVWVEEPATP